MKKETEGGNGKRGKAEGGKQKYIATITTIYILHKSDDKARQKKNRLMKKRERKVK